MKHCTVYLRQLNFLLALHGLSATAELLVDHTIFIYWYTFYQISADKETSLPSPAVTVQ